MTNSAFGSNKTDAYQFYTASANLFRRQDGIGKAMRTMAAALSLWAGDRVVLSKFSSRMVSNYSAPLLVKPACADPHASAETNRRYLAACTNIATDIRTAVALWRQVESELGNQVPDFLDVEFALRSAGIESDMGRLGRKGISPYEGLFQFSRTNKNSLLFTEMNGMLAVLNAGQDKIPILTKYPVVTRDVLLKDEVYNDTMIQVFLKMTSALKADAAFKKIYAQRYNVLASADRLAFLYIGAHLLPGVAGALAVNNACGAELRDLTPEHYPKTYFHGNSGIFQADGHATVTEVFSRFAALTNPYIQKFAPDIAAKDPPITRDPLRPGNQGFLSFVTGTAHNYNNCKIVPREQKDKTWMDRQLAPIKSGLHVLRAVM